MQTLLLFAVIATMPGGEDLACLPPAEGNAAPRAVYYSRLQTEAYQALDRRQQVYEALKTPEQVAEYRAKLREFFVRQLGGFPERTPLNAQTVGTIPAEGFRIEKVVFESQPNHHVTANLYLPEGSGPYPAVLVSSGHSRTAKTAEYNQRFGLMLVRHGLAALCYDPIGQGERSQILNDQGESKFTGTTQEHSLMGVGSILVGTNTARYRIWDAMRAIDYLASRPDIDAQRIGMTGCSGGGTLTSYVMALDDRVQCAAPACYLTTFRRLIETIGPQDAEQNLFNQVAFGLDQPDYVILRAPRPTLISSTTGDFFDIQGSWDTFRQAKRIYARLGHPERVDLVEAEGKHGVQPENLAAIAQWLRRWLLGKDGPVEPIDLPTRTEKELLCTPRGQVLLLADERSVFQLNEAIERQLAKERQVAWEKRSLDGQLQAVREVAGIRPLRDIPPPTREKRGKVEREGYHIDKLVLHTDSGVPLPALTFHPPEPREEAYLYLHEGGKMADGAVGGPIEKLVQDGYVVVSVDLRGQGETAPSASPPDPLLGESRSFFLAYLLGKSVVGMHTEDTLMAGHFLAYYQTKPDQPRKVHLIGVGRASIAALHAAALEPGLFASVTLRDSPSDWASVVGQPVPAGWLTQTVHGALRVYDLPDLRRAIGEGKLKRNE